MDGYVIDVTSELDTKLLPKLQAVANDLNAIIKLEPRVRNIVLRGGAPVDLLLGLEPNDYDLFYSFEENGKTIEECRCDDVQAAIKKAKFSYFEKAKIDLENSYEKEPKAEPVARTCGFISFHTSFANMFCIDQAGHVWTNVETWQDFQNKVFEVRYEGMLPWAYFPRPGDSKDYYSFLCYELIRAVSYMSKRDMIAGKRITILFQNAPYLVQKAIKRKGAKAFKSYCQSKNVTGGAIKSVVSNLNITDKDKKKIISALFKLCA